MFVGVAGTSAACPVVAGIVAIVNNARLKVGKKSLGFLNQFIYANSERIYYYMIVHTSDHSSDVCVQPSVSKMCLT